MNSDGKKIIRITALSIFFIFILVYAFFRSKDLIFGVKITNVNLTDGMVATESVLPVSGNAKNAIYLAVNGREISIDQTGNFEETIALLPGYNVLSIEAKDKFGNGDDKIYKIIYEKALGN